MLQSDLSSRALAIVHLAMYDAFAGVSGNPDPLTPYLPGLPPALPGAARNAAVAAAAHATLSKLFPSQKAFFDLKHTQAGLQGPGLKDGHDFGLLVWLNKFWPIARTTRTQAIMAMLRQWRVARIASIQTIRSRDIMLHFTVQTQSVSRSMSDL